MRASAASLQASGLAWLAAMTTAKSLLGASQAVANHMVLEPEWVSAGPAAQGWSSAMIQPMAYLGSPAAGLAGSGVCSFSSVSGLTSFFFAEGRLAAMNFAQSAMEQWTIAAGPMATGLSEGGDIEPGSTGVPSGW